MRLSLRDHAGANVSAFQLGKEYGNNGQCNPTYFTVGNLVQHLQSLEARGLTKQEIINNYIFFTAGSCGPCRFGMYESEYRLALQNAGFDGFRVLLFQQNDGVKAASGEAGLKFTVDFGMGMFNALNLGDIMNEMIFRIRPYEVEKGKTDRVFHESMDTLCAMLRERKPFEDHEDLPEWMAKKIRANKGKKWEIWVNSLLKVREQLYGDPYKEALTAVHDELATIEVDRLRVKPVVKIIGEFWAQTTEGDGNFHMFEFLEREGAQVLVEPIGTWVMYMMYQVKARAAARRPLDAPYKNVRWYELHKLAKNELKFRQKQWLFGVGERILRTPVSSRGGAAGQHRARADRPEGNGRPGQSVLQPVRARRRGPPGSRQERLLHQEPPLPHGAGAEAVRVHAFVAVGRRAIGRGQSLQGDDLPAHRDLGRRRDQRS